MAPTSTATMTLPPPGTIGPTPTPIRVVIIDDHRMLADSVATALERSDDISVVATAATCADGLHEVRRHKPDVLLLDQRLPDGSGTDLLPSIREASPATRTVLVTGSVNDELVRLALEGGCVGFLTKGERAATLVDAVRKVAAGEAVLSTQDLARMMNGLMPGQTSIGHDLTSRERDVLALLAQGASTSAIASALFIAHPTARNYIQSVISKLGAHSKLEAVTIALRENIVGAA
jgi:DNA-binding NarL/FixJ family response regulator